MEYLACDAPLHRAGLSAVADSLFT